MMKKRIGYVLLSVFCLLLLVSCGSTQANILKEMESVNSDETLVAKYDKIAFRYTYTYADGEVESAYYYQDADRHVSETDYYLEIDENGDLYGFDYELNKPYRCVFVEDAYTDYEKDWCGLTYYVYVEGETILSQEEKDGIITLHTNAMTDKDSVDEYASGYLFEEGVVDHFEMSYKVDAQTNEIIEYTTFAVLPDGTKQTVVECERVLNPEKYVVDEQLKEFIFGGEQRKITITAYPGTDQETVYTQTVSKGSAFQIYWPDGGQVYEDVECTKQFQSASDMTEDVNLTVDVNLYYK